MYVQSTAETHRQAVLLPRRCFFFGGAELDEPPPDAMPQAWATNAPDDAELDEPDGASTPSAAGADGA